VKSNTQAGQNEIVYLTNVDNRFTGLYEAYPLIQDSSVNLISNALLDYI
jgi:hypothetical protein